MVRAVFIAFGKTLAVGGGWIHRGSKDSEGGSQPDFAGHQGFSEGEYVVTWDGYNAGVARTIPAGVAHRDHHLVNFALGEAGEVADLIKKQVCHGHAPEPDSLLEELGDVLWCVTALAQTLDVPLEEVARAFLKRHCERTGAGSNIAPPCPPRGPDFDYPA